jgi:SGNH domain-containing protein
MWGENNDLGKLRQTIDRLKALGVPRIVILGPVPVWKRTLPHSLVNFYRFRHSIADRIGAGVTGPQGDHQMEAFSKGAGAEYISAWHALCNSEGCKTRVGPTANDVIATDIIHLSDAGSRFLVEAIGKSLFHRPG